MRGGETESDRDPEAMSERHTCNTSKQGRVRMRERVRQRQRGNERERDMQHE